MFHSESATSKILLFSVFNLVLHGILADSFNFITLPQEQQQSIQSQLSYQQQFQFGQQQQQQQQQQPFAIQPLYGNENAKQYSTQININQQLSQQQQQQQRQQYYQQQQQQYLSSEQPDSNGYKFHSLTNMNLHTNNQQTILNQNQNQNRIQMQQYSQVPLTFDDKTSHTNQQQFYYPLSYADLAKSQQQQRQQQQQEKQWQHQQQPQSQYTQHNQQQIQRFSPEYNYASTSSSLPLSTSTQPTSKMSTAFIRRLPVPSQQQQQQQQQLQIQQRPQISSQKESQQILSKPSKPDIDNNFSELLPSYLFNTDDSMNNTAAVCTRCCHLNQNPCLECCSESGFLSPVTLKVLAG